MKTAVHLASSLLKRARKLAAKRAITLDHLIELALREALEAEPETAGPFKLETHVFRGEGLQSGLGWDDWSRIREMSYVGRGG